MENHEHGPTSSIRAKPTWIEAAAATRTGRRRTNADAFVIDQAADVYAVADGMGDTRVSGLIARKALEAVQQVFGAHWRSLPPAERALEDAKFRITQGVVLAHEYISAPYLPLRERIGATFAGVVACGDMICAAHAGDSRVYLLRRGKAGLAQITEDHTGLTDALRRGVLYDVAVSHRDAHKLTRVLGVKLGPEVEPVVRSWEPGDVVLLCTNGVSDYVGARAMADILLDAGEVGEVARRIVDRADEAGGFDNATVVVLRRVS